MCEKILHPDVCELWSMWITRQCTKPSNGRLEWSWLAAYCALEFLITITIAHMILIMHFVHHQRSRFFTWLHNSCPQQLLVLNKVPHETCSYKILFKKTFHNWELQLDRKNTSKKILIYAYLVWTLHIAYLEDPELPFSLWVSLVAITSSSLVYNTVAVVSPIFHVPS